MNENLDFNDLLKGCGINRDELIKTQNLYYKEVSTNYNWHTQNSMTYDSLSATVDCMDFIKPEVLKDDERVLCIHENGDVYLVHTVKGWLLAIMPGDYSAVIIHNDTFILSGRDGTKVYDLVPASGKKRCWVSECYH